MRGVAESFHRCMLNFLKNYQTVLQSGTIYITTSHVIEFQFIGILSNTWYDDSF